MGLLNIFICNIELTALGFDIMWFPCLFVSEILGHSLWIYGTKAWSLQTVITRLWLRNWNPTMHFLCIFLLIVILFVFLHNVSSVPLVCPHYWIWSIFSSPHTWYPKARSKPRKVILHMGPTNSGKTHNALKRLESSPSGRVWVLSL